jgi:hypothetical protein
MAFSPTDPVSAHSLWLQLRSTKRKTTRPRWRSNWTPLWVPLLLLSVLATLYMMMPTAFEQSEQTSPKGTVLQERPMVGALAGP